MSMGLVPHQENALAFALSASFASVGGVAASIAIGYLEPDSFNLDAGVMLIVATVVGGIASFWGAAVGAAIVSGTPEVFRGLHDVSAFALGFVMVAVLLFMPRGLVPTLAGLWRQRGGKTLVKVELARPSDHDGEQVERRIAALAARLMPQRCTAVRVHEPSHSGLIHSCLTHPRLLIGLPRSSLAAGLIILPPALGQHPSLALCGCTRGAHRWRAAGGRKE
jgi:hypothetical protein